jgi:hypothetical protein
VRRSAGYRGNGSLKRLQRIPIGESDANHHRDTERDAEQTQQRFQTFAAEVAKVEKTKKAQHSAIYGKINLVFNINIFGLIGNNFISFRKMESRWPCSFRKLNSKVIRGIQIVSPKAFLEILDQQKTIERSARHP